MSDKKKKKSGIDKFFNMQLYKTLLMIAEWDLLKAIDCFETYLEIFPDDYSAYCMYASNLIKIRRFKEAEIVLDEALEKYNRKKFDNKEKESLFYNNLHFTRIKLLCYQGKYQDCLNYCREHKEELIKKDINLGLTIHYCIKQLNSKNSDKYISANNGYLYNQMLDYSYEAFRKHIEKHFVDYKPKDNEEITSFFFKGFPIDKVLEEINNYIPNKDNSYCCGFFDNYYYFRYDDCGRCLKDKDRKCSADKNYKSRLVATNYFKVITFHNTSNIITISPCENTKGLPYIDLNYIKDQVEQKPEKKDAVKTFIKKWY